jgi:hypothetical protein
MRTYILTPSAIGTCIQELRRPKTVYGLVSKVSTNIVRFEVFTAVTMKNAVFWDVAPCRSCVNRRFGGTYRLHLQGRIIRGRGTNVSRCSHLCAYENNSLWEKPELIVLRYAYIKAKAFRFCNMPHLDSNTNASIKFNKEQGSVSVQ